MNLPGVHPLLLDLLKTERVATPTPPDSAWSRIIRDAAEHGLAPWLYRWSCESPALVPPQVHDRLKATVAAVAGRNLVLADELATILRELDRRGIPCAPLRGLALARYLPDAPSVRPMGDLDLLVKREDYSDVRRTLQRLGYVETDRRPGFAQAYSYTLEFVKDRHGWITVEPHWTVAYPPFMESIDMDAVWKRCRRGTVAGVETWLLSLEDLLANLCWHVNHKGGDAPLLWWHELDLLIRRDAAAVDWNRFVSSAGRGAPAGLVADVLTTLVRAFRSPIPDRVIAELKRSAAVDAPRSARLCAGPLAVDGVESLAQLFAVKGLRARIHYAWALLVPSREFMVLRYAPTSPARLYLQYARRLLACMWESLKGLVNLIVPVRRPFLP